MQLTGKNAEYADLILSKLMDNGGWISKDEILGILHDTYDYAAEPEFVLHDLVDNWKFIIVDGEILRLTKEGDKAAKKGVAQYCKGKEKKELFKVWKDYLSVGETLINIMVALASFFLGTLLFQLVLEGEDDDPGNDSDEYGHDAGEEGSLELKSSDAVLQNVCF